jgi:hypothetical protein
MDRWDVLLIAMAAYVSVMALVRMMAHHRNQLVTKIRAEIEKQRAAAAARQMELEQAEQEAA